MNQRKKEILKIEEDFRDTIENDLNNRDTKKIEIKDIKFVGEAIWKDKVNGKDISEKVFIVEKEFVEINESGKEERTQVTNLYIGNRCVGGTLGNGEIIYSDNFKNSEKDKFNAINELLQTVSDKEIEENSLNSSSDISSRDLSFEMQ